MTELIENFNNLVWWYKVLIILLCVCVVLGIIAWCNKEKVRLWWLGFWTSFPVFGTIASLYRSVSSTDKSSINGWLEQEQTLCAKFKPFYDENNTKDKDLFAKAKIYLERVEETGRSPFPKPMWIIVFLLVIAEALGFAYVLAGYTLPGASEALQQKGSYVIAFIVSIILVGFTHFAGHEIYVNSVRKKIITSFANSNDTDLSNKQTMPIDFKPEDDDKDAPRWQKIINRVNCPVDASRSWWVCIITAILIITFAVGAAYVRGQVLEKQLTQEISGLSTNAYETAPEELAQIQTEADNKAIIDQQSLDRKGGWATFIILSILFVFIQILGIIFGIKWGFAGEDSQKAYKTLNSPKQFISENEFVTYWDNQKKRIVNLAQEKLKILQQKIEKKHGKREWKKFTDYILEYAKNDLATEYNQEVKKSNHQEKIDNILNTKTHKPAQSTTQAQETLSATQAKEVAAQTTAIDNTEQIKALFGQIDDLLDSYEKDSSRRLKREIEEKLDELKNLGADSQKIANLEQEFEKIQGSKNA
ncbi:MAG: hypothetical protein MSA33_08470 [Campylobacter sp.]|uniref:hypothetical protein n=1 Tax=Campylobacter sp. TaxID=205 RepID=UPI002AA70EE5|nr:hypothetical protein [Campylobacter sp.]MCI7550458.1 hypothetical protein [Campylobacter sp.]